MSVLPWQQYSFLPKRLPLSLGFKRYALKFDSNNGYVHVINSSLFKQRSELSIETLFKPERLGIEQVLNDEGGSSGSLAYLEQTTSNKILMGWRVALDKWLSVASLDDWVYKPLKVLT